MTREKLLKTLITFKCFSDRNLNILLLNKKDVDIKLLNECRDEETSMLIKDYNIIGKVFDDFLEHNIFTKDELKEKLSIFASNDFEVSIHDLSHINYLNEDITSLLEGLVNQADEKTDVNIILLNEKIINIIKVIYKCVFIDVKKEDWLSILIDFEKAALFQLDLKLKLIEKFNQKINNFDEKISKVKDILSNLKNKNKENGFVRRTKGDNTIQNKDDSISETIEEINNKFEILNIVEPKQGFEEILGLTSVKKMLSKLIKLYSEDIDNLAKHKIERDKGFILYGEPGTGKTMLCKAFAKELNGIFVYLSMEQFVSRKNENMTIAALFDEINLISQDYSDKTIVVFFDEMDSLRGRGKSNHNNSYYDGFTNEMLYRIDNLPKNVMLIGATNNLETIDKAIIRKGRLGNQYEVKNNFKKEEVVEFIKEYFNNSKMSTLNKYATFISTMIYYMNGSEISNILNKIKQNYYFKDEKQKIKPLIIETIYNEKYNIADYETTPEDEMIVAYHEAGHALAYMNFYGTKKLHEISIYPTEKALGFVSYKFDKNNVTKEDLKQKTIISLAGRYAEKLITNNISTGASSDLENANGYITKILNKFGMGDIENYSNNLENSSDYILTKLDKEHEALLKEYSEETKKLIDKNKVFIETLAKDLVKEKVLIDVFEKYEKLIIKD